MSTMITLAAPTGGIQPVPQHHAELLNEMELVCRDLVKLLELERSGVRNGQGFWPVEDPILSKMQRLSSLAEQHRVISTGK